ncbi:MAG: ParB/RepB/Spo0J family partition protein [Chloroflexales bacterium]
MPPRAKSFFPHERETERRADRAQAVEDLVASRLAPRPVVSHDIAINRIRPNPYQARRAFSDLEELAESIRQQGFISRLRVRPDPSTEGLFQLVYGERRLRAAELAGLITLPCDVAPHTDRELIEIGLVENIQRQDLNPLEEARAFQTFISKLDYSIRSLAERLGKHRSYIEGRLALLRAPEDVQELVLRRPDTLDAARQIARVPDPMERQALIEGVAKGALTSQTVRERVNARRTPPVVTGAGVETDQARPHDRKPDSIAQRMQQDIVLVESVLTAWEALRTEQPGQFATLQDRLVGMMFRIQVLLDQEPVK